MNKLLSAILFLTLAGVSVNGVADEHDEDEVSNVGKVVICHKGRKSISVGTPGLSAHMKHGDTEGPCVDGVEPDEPDDSDADAAVVMMHCQADSDTGKVVVTAFSSSVIFSEQPLSEIDAGDDCADSLAALLNADFYLKSVTGDTDYLLLGEKDD